MAFIGPHQIYIYIYLYTFLICQASSVFITTPWTGSSRVSLFEILLFNCSFVPFFKVMNSRNVLSDTAIGASNECFSRLVPVSDARLGASGEGSLGVWGSGQVGVGGEGASTGRLKNCGMIR